MEKRSKLREFADTLLAPRHHYRDGVFSFPKLDLAALKRELRPAELGAERGKAELPPSEGDELDEIELRIANAIQAKREEAQEQATAEFMTLAERLAATDVEGRATDIKIEVDSRIADFIAAIAHGENRLYVARRQVLEAEQGLADFKLRNGLTRPADYPESAWLSFGIIAAIVLTESVLNAIFLGEAQRYGILGGFAIAAMIAVANVTVGFAAGRWAWSRLFHRRWLVKLGGFAILCITVALLAAINLGTAHYRAALLGGNFRTAEYEAIATLLAQPLGLGDLKSWLLLVVGSISAVIAAQKGYGWDDPYPGYGKRDRLYRRIVRAYEEVMLDVMDNIDEIKNEAVAEARALKNAIDKRRQDRARILASRKRLADNFAHHMRHLEGVFRELISAYRDANVKARSTPAPGRFAHHPSFDATSILVSEDLDSRKAESAYQRINETIETAIEKLLAEHAGAQSRFKSIETLSMEEISRATQREPAIAA